MGNVSGIRLGFVAVFGTRVARSSTEHLVVVAETRVTQREGREKLVSKIWDLSSELLEAPPDDVVLVPPGSVPKTPSGKIRRSACRELYEKGELGRKHRSAGLQMVRLALSGLGPGLGRAVRAAGRILYAGWSWGTALALSGPVWLAIASVPGLGVRRAVLQFSARLWLRLAGIRVSATGLSNIPVDRPRCLSGPIRATWIFVLAAVLPRALSSLPRRSSTAPPSCHLPPPPRYPLRRANSAEQGVQDAADAVKAVRAGQGLVVYPEGTFRRAPGLRPFKLGGFLVAAQAGVPLLPVTIRGMRSILRDGQKVPRPGRASISFGVPLDSEGGDWNAAVSCAIAHARRSCVAAESQIWWKRRNSDVEDLGAAFESADDYAEVLSFPFFDLGPEESELNRCAGGQVCRRQVGKTQVG